MSFLTEMENRLNEGILDKIKAHAHKTFKGNVSPSDEEFDFAMDVVKREYGDDATIGGIGVDPVNGNIAVEVAKQDGTPIDDIDITPEGEIK